MESVFIGFSAEVFFFIIFQNVTEVFRGFFESAVIIAAGSIEMSASII